MAEAEAVTWSGVWPSCVATLTSKKDASGPVEISFKANDGQLDSNVSRPIGPDVRITAVTSTRISFAWDSNLGKANRVKVAPASLQTAGPADCSDASKVSLEAGVTTYTYSGLTPATAYRFQCCAFDGTSSSEGTKIWYRTP